MKASKRRARARKQIKHVKSQGQSVVAAAFSDFEEAFFREGAALSAAGSNGAIETFADLDTPLSLYLKLAHGRNTFLLESVVGGERVGR